MTVSGDMVSCGWGHLPIRVRISSWLSGSYAGSCKQGCIVRVLYTEGVSHDSMDA
jgi:hypothetical protein